MCIDCRAQLIGDDSSIGYLRFFGLSNGKVELKEATDISEKVSWRQLIKEFMKLEGYRIYLPE